MVVLLEVGRHEGIDLAVGDLAEVLHHLADGAVVYMVAQPHLGLDLVAVRDGHVVHLVAEAHDEQILRIGPGCGYALPYGDVLQRLAVLPVADYHLARPAHAGRDVAELAVAVGALVQVHEVHVDLVPRNLAVVLRVEMQQRLLELLQPVNPHLGGREGVHPGHYADALVIGFGRLHDRLHLLRGVGRALVDHLHGQKPRGVHPLDHLRRMGIDGLDGVAAV